MDNRKILFAINSFEIGGAELQLISLISRIQQKYFSCHVFALQQGGPLLENLISIGVPVYTGGLKSWDIQKAPWKAIQAQIKLIGIVLKLRPHIVHSYLPLVTFMGSLAGRIGRAQLVISSRRGLSTHQDRHKLLRPLDLLSERFSHRVVVNSRAVWDDTIDRDRIDPSKLVLIYNGVNPVPFEEALRNRAEVREKLGIMPHEKVSITIANLIPYKGHSDLLKAARTVVDRIPEATFLFVGEDRGIKNELEGEASDLGILRQVKFLGRRTDIPNLLAASDLSILPSHEEGFSNVILESMAAGLPVIATSVGGNSEAIVDGLTGWLVPTSDPCSLAEKITDLLLDPARSRSWGDQGRERVKQLFTIERMLKSHLTLYQRCFHHRSAEEFRSA